MAIPTKFDVSGLMRAFLDHDRQAHEYFLDTVTGRVHFIPVVMLRTLERGGRLNWANLLPQDRERAMIAQAYLDDVDEARYELIPFVEPSAVEEWKGEFLAGRGESAVVATNRLAWETYLADRVLEEIELWVDEAGFADEPGETDEDVLQDEESLASSDEGDEL